MAGTEPGTYVLVMWLNRECELRVGRLGCFRLVPGWYLYVGSALGAGGWRARVARHARAEKRRHWHIDYLLAEARLHEVWATASPVRQECEWARVLAQYPGMRTPVHGFGASDCRCKAHLFAMTERPTPDALAGALGARLEWSAAEPPEAQPPIPS
jgi:Uri superfamily endonuclease